MEESIGSVIDGSFCTVRLNQDPRTKKSGAELCVGIELLICEYMTFGVSVS